MSTVVVRLFLDKDAEPQVRAVLEQLKVSTVEKEQPTNGSQVINVFDPSGFSELAKRKFPKKEQAVLIASGDFSLGSFSRIYANLKQKGAVLLGIVDPSRNDWQLYFKYLLG
ncbi:hypothetical protein KKC62_00525 [Patescibacteria group bacterium]|nr:hypothetical protein [Patescibacteria group bacterium]MBU1952692.1 hypothetical protein [Patescibacteria group bacterium]